VSINKFKNEISPYCELLFALIAAALWYMHAGAIWWIGSWPLFLLGGMWVLYWTRTGLKFQLSPVDVLLALFMFSAWVGTQTAYDSESAWAKFWLIVGAWGLYYAIDHQPDPQHLYAAMAVFGLFGIALTSYYFMTNDWWVTHPIKIRSLVVLGEAISARLPRLSAQGFNPNVVGGLQAMVIPFYVPLIAMTRGKSKIGSLPSRGRLWLRMFWWLAAGWSGLGLLVTTSRGAWVAILIGFAIWLVWWGTGNWFQRSPVSCPWAKRLWIMVGVLVFVTVACLVLIGVIVMRGWSGSAALTNRLTLLRDSLLLARDCAWTGVGLGAYMMNFSIYTLLIHVGYIHSSHNFLLDILIEQGILGCGAYVGLVIFIIYIGIRRLRHEASWVRYQIEAGLVSLMVILIHGLVEDTLYGHRGLLFLFVPMGFVSMGSEFNGLGAKTAFVFPPVSMVGIIFIFCITLSLISFARPAFFSSLYASLGAATQAKIELASYNPDRYEEHPIDLVRRDVNLDAAIDRFEQSLKWNPQNLTSRQRLATIGLSRGAYDSASAHMTAAWNAGHRDSVTRLLYGDTLVAGGQIEQAAAVMDGLKWAELRLDEQAWSRYWAHEEWVRAAYAWRTLELLDLEDRTASKYAEDAEARISQQP
jgi:hypothetical protein